MDPNRSGSASRIVSPRMIASKSMNSTTARASSPPATISTRHPTSSSMTCRIRRAPARLSLTIRMLLSGKVVAREVSSIASVPSPVAVCPRNASSSTIIFIRVSEATRLINATSSKGFDRKSSAPASSPFTLSDCLSSAVSMTTGTCRVAGFSFRRRQVSNPSIPGIMTSRRMMSGDSATAISMACSPFSASITS